MNKQHPLSNLRSKLLRVSPEIKLHFSRYVSGGQGITLSRKTFSELGSQVNPVWFENQIHSLKPDEELALHSKVFLGDLVRHIPMIDFIAVMQFKDIEKRIQLVELPVNSPLYLYRSGRSFHGYFFELLTETQWRNYLGDLLLLNSPSPKVADIVDSRWVGHSLNQGFSALRWSLNTSNYEEMPSAVKDIRLN